ncbi:MAG: hypothetical protein JXR96_28155 [Deltaproteobacteria bacterium]|nr:hypothetical protein [Deltaproteobacteria bacterium]
MLRSVIPLDASSVIALGDDGIALFDADANATRWSRAMPCVSAALLAESRQIAVSTPEEIQLLSLDDGRALRTAREQVFGLAASGAVDLLAGVSSSGDRVSVWDTGTLERLGSLDIEAARCVTFSGQTDHLACGLAAGVEVRRAREGDLVLRVVVPTPSSCSAAAVNAVALGPDGRLLAAAGWGEVLMGLSPEGEVGADAGEFFALRLWRIAPALGAELQSWEATLLAQAWPHSLTHVQLSPDGAALLAAGGDAVLIFACPGSSGDGSPLEPRAKLEWYDLDAAPRSAAFTPDGEHVLIGLEDGTVGAWNLALEPIWKRALPRVR